MADRRRRPVTPLEAALLIQADYANAIPIELVKETLDIDGCQSTILDVPPETVLLIRGSNERLDWRRNFNFLPTPGPGDQFWWHRGFLHHAQVAYSFAKGKRITFVIGHSLGGACTQLVCLGLSVPGFGFAAPQVLFAPDTMVARPPNLGPISIYNRTDDMICRLPPCGFEHVGTVNWLEPLMRHPGQDHSIEFYVEILSAQAAAEAITI